MRSSTAAALGRETALPGSAALPGSTAPDVAADAVELEVCALPGCDVRLPIRALDEQGRPKGGRRPRYCGKPHTDAASRQRKARDLESVADPLALARTAGEAFLPSARQLTDQLTELIARFDQAEAGALGRVRAAEQEAAAALADTAVAREAAEIAEQARRQALAQARADRQARDNAVKEAEHARQDLERIRTGAWEQVVGHERARGQAEAARVAAETAAEGLTSQNRALREQLELTRSATVALSDQITVGTHELERSRGERLALSARIETVEQLRAQEADRLREQVATLERRSAQAEADLAAERSTTLAAKHFTAQEAARLGQRIAALEELTSRLRDQLAEERSVRQADGRALEDARRTLSAQARRRRKHRPPTTGTTPVPDDPPART